MITSILYVCERTFSRYELYLPRVDYETHKGAYAKERLAHAIFWHPNKINKVVVHSNSKKLINQNDLYASLFLALAIISAQSPRIIKSKQSISGFKMMQNTVLGSCVHLRHHNRIWFCYKWAFLGPNAGLFSQGKTGSALGFKNMFAFELDSLDYDAFEAIAGCDVQWHFKA